MGLFSIFSKNKQDRTAQESGRTSGSFGRDDDDIGQQARAKRASHANQANESGQGGSRRSRSGGDPMLPEKARTAPPGGGCRTGPGCCGRLADVARFRAAPLSGDIAIQIPSKDKAPALPMPASPVPAADSVDQDEEIIAPAPAGTPGARSAAEKPAVAKEAPPLVYTEREVKPVKAEPKEPKVAEHKNEQKPVEHKPEPKPERKVAEKPVEKPPVKKLEEKPLRPKDTEAARAMALLEGKPAAKAEAKAEEKHPRVEDKADAGQRFVVQVAALATQEKVDELQARLRAGGISSFTKKSGSLIKVQVGPFGSREEADKTKAKLGALGLGGFLVQV